jgi:hypothetical protein
MFNHESTGTVALHNPFQAMSLLIFPGVQDKLGPLNVFICAERQWPKGN